MGYGWCPGKATSLSPDSQVLLVLSGVICLPTTLQTPSCFSWSLSLCGGGAGPRAWCSVVCVMRSQGCMAVRGTPGWRKGPERGGSVNGTTHETRGRYCRRWGQPLRKRRAVRRGMGSTGASHPGVSDHTRLHHTGHLRSAYCVLGIAVNSSPVLIYPILCVPVTPVSPMGKGRPDSRPHSRPTQSNEM